MQVATSAKRAPTTGAWRASTWRALAVILLALAVAGLSAAPGAQAACTPPPGANPIVVENCKDGSPPSDWDVPGSGDAGLQGFATDISVNRGSSVQFKIDATTTAYHLDIYRMGYYGGLGARRVATGIAPSNPVNQGACTTNGGTGLVDCGNWVVSASWSVPGDAVPGIYFAAAVRNDNSGASHIFFVVRDDGSRSDLYYQTSDTTWQAYNNYGGNSLYSGTSSAAPGRAVKVSYNRPFVTRSVDGGQDWVFHAEYPMVRWLERNGYDVSYSTGVDTDRAGALLKNHKVFISSGHDEYWSGQQRANVEAARAAGVNLAFFSGNEIFWKTRWEDSHRTLVTYKETHGDAVDPDPNTWTGTWMDPRPFNPEGANPQNALSGTLFSVTNGTFAIQVPAEYGPLRFWRNTSIAGSSGTTTLASDTLGYEWDSDIDNGSRPAGLFDVSSATYTAPGVLQDYGSTYAPGTATHNMTLYRAPSGALVFGAGTVQWAWGLDGDHDSGPTTPDVRMQHATVNLLADMHAQPGTLQSGLTAAAASTDTIPPYSTITSPTTVVPGTPVTIHGTAADEGGGRVAAVEVSLDGGLTWHPAAGRESWQYAGTPTSPTPMSRAIDDSGNYPGRAGTQTSPQGTTPTGPAGSGSATGGSASAAKRGPRVAVTPRTVRASRAGTVSLRVACPRSARRCRVALRLELRHRVIAKKTVTVTGGKTRKVTLKLTRAVRRELPRKRSLKVTAIATTTDRAGHRATTRTSILLLAPRRR
jgi:hypothetical protein